jgi:ribosomal-protein-alanine N-acetyltransferase
MTNWFKGHPDEWREGTAYRLAITLESRLIGVCDVFDIGEGEGEIGYWLDRTVWGRGFGLEAARQLVRFAMEDVGLTSVRAGCADDNAASAAILTRLGFSRLEDVRVFSKSREAEITQRRFQLAV